MIMAVEMVMFTASIVQPPIGCKAALQPIVLSIQIQAAQALSLSDSQINSFVICCSHKLPDVSSREHTESEKPLYAGLWLHDPQQEHPSPAIQQYDGGQQQVPSQVARQDPLQIFRKKEFDILL